MARLAADYRTFDALTPRELDVLRLMVAGRSNREIAASLEIGDETVKTQMSHVLAKLEVENRVQAIAQAPRRRLVSVEDL